MLHRREFLAASGLGLASLMTFGSRTLAAFDGTWLVYALDAETFWKTQPFPGRLRKIAETGFTRYDFGRWKTKDIDAIAKINEELGLQASFFTGYSGLSGPRWKEGLLDSIEDAVDLAGKLGAARIGVVGGDLDEKRDREDQVDELVEGLQAAIEKVAESDVVLILEPGVTSGRGKPLLTSLEETIAIARAVGSTRVKVAFTIRRAEADGGKVPGQIKKIKDQVGLYRLADLDIPAGSEAGYARIIRTIHDVGHGDPIGVGLRPKTDPMATIEALRKVDDAAKALAG